MKIKGIITDVDGVLTDGGFYTGASCTGRAPNGLMMKKFHTRDASAVHRLREAGLKWGIVTGSGDVITKIRMKVMMPDIQIYNEPDKLAGVTKMCEAWGISLKEVAYIGDDHMDVPALKAVGQAYVPMDSQIRGNITIINLFGGCGVFAAVVDLILQENE